MKKMRPSAITNLCLIGLLPVLFGIFNVFAAVTATTLLKLPGKDQAVLVFSVTSLVIEIISLIGIWKMKKWGVFLYTALFASIILFRLGMVATEIGSTKGGGASLDFVLIMFMSIIPVATIIAGFYYIKKMT